MRTDQGLARRFRKKILFSKNIAELLSPADGFPLLPQIVEEVNSMAARNNMCSLRGIPPPGIEHMLFVVSLFAFTIRYTIIIIL